MRKNNRPFAMAKRFHPSGDERAMVFQLQYDPGVRINF
jgi:hypothetical protein